MTFKELCHRWRVSANSSKSTVYDTMKEQGIISTPNNSKLDWEVNEKKLAEFEKKIGFVDGMVSVTQYGKEHNLKQQEVTRLIRKGLISYCILCKTENRTTYRVV